MLGNFKSLNTRKRHRICDWIAFKTRVKTSFKFTFRSAMF